jgi:hypothetical protein
VLTHYLDSLIETGELSYIENEFIFDIKVIEKTETTPKHILFDSKFFKPGNKIGDVKMTPELKSFILYPYEYVTMIYNVSEDDSLEAIKEVAKHIKEKNNLPEKTYTYKKKTITSLGKSSSRRTRSRSSSRSTRSRSSSRSTRSRSSSRRTRSRSSSRSTRKVQSNSQVKITPQVPSKK